jgi:hypothetical protein
VLYSFRSLDRREHELNAIGKGKRKGFAGESAEATTAVITAAGERRDEASAVTTNEKS